MNKTKIETFDYTWNPVTGCLKGCEYCYAKRSANRLYSMKKRKIIRSINYPGKAPYYIAAPGALCPRNFEPTYYPHRLQEPIIKKKPSTIFVCSMGDLLGDWVPKEWIERVIITARMSPQHTFFFLTKNPKRYEEFEWPKNCWLGTTVTRQQDFDRVWELDHANLLDRKMWVSVEPMLGKLDFSPGPPADWVVVGLKTINGKPVSPDTVPFDHFDIADIYDPAAFNSIPLYMKDSLADIWPGELIKELPE